jgi:hypothetical protein
MAKNSAPTDAAEPMAAPAADPRDAEIVALQSELAAMAARVDAEAAARAEADAKADAARDSEARMRVSLVSAREQLAVATAELKRRPPLPTQLANAKFVALAKVAINYDGTITPVGQPLPFDPLNPPPGCDGLVEGEHYTLV